MKSINFISYYHTLRVNRSVLYYTDMFDYLQTNKFVINADNYVHILSKNTIILIKTPLKYVKSRLIAGILHILKILYCIPNIYFTNIIFILRELRVILFSAQNSNIIHNWYLPFNFKPS
jgi:hypothetical protein